METRSVRITVLGRVQGVFYRKSTKEQAEKLEVFGWVKNQLDGSVLIEAVGKSDNIEKFIDWCRQGPPASKVENLRIEEIAQLDCTDFSVKYF